METIKKPFTQEQVDNLNHYQNEGKFHPFTCCGGDKNTPNCQRNAGTSEGVLIATVDGWVCPCGEYKQDWAHDFMDKTPNKKEE